MFDSIVLIDTLSIPMPSYLRNAYITPIFKEGNMNSPENYRPLSLISFPCKVIKNKVVKKFMVNLKKSTEF